MALIGTEGDRFSNIFKYEFDPSSGVTREVVTVNIASTTTLAPGTVLAKIAASGKYVVQDASLASGSGLNNLVVLIGTDEVNLGASVTSGVDKKVLVLARGPAKVVKSKLVVAAATDTAAELQAVYDDLAAKGIVVVDQL